MVLVPVTLSALLVDLRIGMSLDQKRPKRALTCDEELFSIVDNALGVSQAETEAISSSEPALQRINRL